MHAQKRKKSSFIIMTDRIPCYYPAVASDNFVANKIANFWIPKELLRIGLNQRYVYSLNNSLE